MPWHRGKSRIAIGASVVLSLPVHQLEIPAFCIQLIVHRPQLLGKWLQVSFYHAGLIILADYELGVHEDCQPKLALPPRPLYRRQQAPPLGGVVRAEPTALVRFCPFRYSIIIGAPTAFRK